MVTARILRFMTTGALRFALCAPAVFAGVAPCIAKQSAALAAYPVKPIRIIVASSPGTANDFFARALGEELGAFYRQSVVIENRSGAGGLIGNAMVSRANADGYTLGMVGVTRIITELMRDQPPYRALADIVGVAHVASITNVLAVAPSMPVRTAPEFVAYARARVGELNYASLGIGSASHLAGEVFTRAVGIDAMHVPFRNLSDTFVEMVLGRVHYAVFTLPAVLAPVRDGRLRALAVMTPQAQPGAAGACRRSPSSACPRRSSTAGRASSRPGARRGASSSSCTATSCACCARRRCASCSRARAPSPRPRARRTASCG